MLPQLVAHVPCKANVWRKESEKDTSNVKGALAHLVKTEAGVLVWHYDKRAPKPVAAL